jgi:ribosomal protein S18 acetylase RimI-like enzyme
MTTVRDAQVADIPQIAAFEAEIAAISFGDDAVTDPAQHVKKLQRAIDRGEDIMLVLAEGAKVLGWLWVSINTNMFTGDSYANFRSFILAKELRGSEWADKLFQAGIAQVKEYGEVTRVVGKVHVDNLPMRVLYKEWGFQPQHLTMELALPRSEQK